MSGYATLIVALIVAIAIALVAEARAKPSVEDVARAYFEYGYARGQQDVLEGVTIVGQADQYKLPPITREQLIKWREARYTAVQTLEAAK